MVIQTNRGASTQESKVGRKLATLAGAAGAAAVGQDAMAVALVPTANVVAAYSGTNGITGFSYNTSTGLATSGTLRPLPLSGNFSQSLTEPWDIDGDGGQEFHLVASRSKLEAATLNVAFLSGVGAVEIVGNNSVGMLNLAKKSGNNYIQNVVGSAAPFRPGTALTEDGGLLVSQFTLNSPGYFGFKFVSNDTTLYG